MSGKVVGIRLDDDGGLLRLMETESNPMTLGVGDGVVPGFERQPDLPIHVA